MGWQLDRIASEFPLYIAWSWLSVVIIWLCVGEWAGAASDWATTMMFGQLLAASVSLIVLYTRESR
jgi:hypothetical protein